MRKHEMTPIEIARSEKRKQAVDAVGRGESPSTVARVLRVSLRTLFHWLALSRHGGYDALQEGKRPGRPRKVNAEVMRWLYDAITLGDPRQHQFEFCLWTLAIVRAMWKREHGIEPSKSGISRLWRHLGLSPQIPKYKSYKQNPAEMRKYLQRRFPHLVRQARRTGAVIYFVDEAAVRADAHRGSTWGAVGVTPLLADSGDRHTLKMISAGSARGDMKFAICEGSMNADRFAAFVRDLRADTGQPIIVIADNAAYHKSGPLRRYRRANPEQIRIAHLPPYAPELNPDEQVWNNLKRRLAKFFIQAKEAMRRQVDAVLQSIQSSAELVRSFFELEDTKYAANPA